jgi:hypothetical protein
MRDRISIAVLLSIGAAASMAALYPEVGAGRPVSTHHH